MSRKSNRISTTSSEPSPSTRTTLSAPCSPICWSPTPTWASRAARPVEHPGFTRIVRAGIAYYAKPDFKILNPFKEGGNGVYFVKGCNDDPTGIFFTDAYRVNDAEYGDAIEAYLFAYGIPRDDLAMVPVTFWPRTYERTPENIAALRAVGAPLPNEGL